MEQYLKILQNILDNGCNKGDRTGTGTVAVAGNFFQHDMSEGFPVLTTKKIPFSLVASELEFFIKGITDKKWLHARNNHIWDEWCSSDKIAYSHDPDVQKLMAEEPELGPIYGWQWRHFGGEYIDKDTAPVKPGIDQLSNLIHLLKTEPDSRRMLVVAWNPVDNPRMALPPCHWSFQCTVLNNKLNLLWTQRSVDAFLGLPFNITSYALLLHLLAKECGLQEGRLCGFLADTHIYTTHLAQVHKQLSRSLYTLPNITTNNFTSIFDWEYTDSTLTNYRHHPGISAPIAI